MDECIALMVNSFFNLVDLFKQVESIVPILAIGVLFALGLNLIYRVIYSILSNAKTDRDLQEWRDEEYTEDVFDDDGNRVLWRKEYDEDGNLISSVDYRKNRS